MPNVGTRPNLVWTTLPRGQLKISPGGGKLDKQRSANGRATCNDEPCLISYFVVYSSSLARGSSPKETRWSGERNQRACNVEILNYGRRNNCPVSTSRVRPPGGTPRRS